MICSECKCEVPDRDVLLCSRCRIEHHFVCQNIKDSNFRKMSAETKSKWCCSKCKLVNTGTCSSTVAGLSTTDKQSQLDSDGKSSSASLSLSLTKADLEAIGRIVREMIQAELSPIKQEFSAIKESIEFISNEFDHFKSELSTFKNKVEELKKENTTLKCDNNKLKSQLDSIHEYTRRDNLIITGIPETANESVYEIFNSVSTAISSPLTSKDLSTAHRLPTRIKGKNSIKPIVVKFVRRQDKETWLADFRKMSSMDKTSYGIATKSINKSLPDGNVLAHQHLPPQILEQLKQVREVASEKGYKFVWSREGKIFVRKDTNQAAIVIHRKEDLNSL
ncbi:uncharacterized protein LOC120353422 [Nilaparvata lugens]|uniref:uncharacterized protein LOC120353422 n=1 Tax=Nilaparvata lugens TaxID=108931 RepID=UPI00193CCC89|nr:uncharacterized protein LOC120353422 [Nilaparvata lugens]